jgi:hypothetical protein
MRFYRPRPFVRVSPLGVSAGTRGGVSFGAGGFLRSLVYLMRGLVWLARAFR